MRDLVFGAKTEEPFFVIGWLIRQAGLIKNLRLVYWNRKLTFCRKSMQSFIEFDKNKNDYSRHSDTHCSFIFDCFAETHLIRNFASDPETQMLRWLMRWMIRLDYNFISKCSLFVLLAKIHIKIDRILNGCFERNAFGTRTITLCSTSQLLFGLNLSSYDCDVAFDAVDRLVSIVLGASLWYSWAIPLHFRSCWNCFLYLEFKFSPKLGIRNLKKISEYRRHKPPSLRDSSIFELSTRLLVSNDDISFNFH